MTTYRSYDKFRTAVLKYDIARGMIVNMSMRDVDDNGVFYSSIEEMKNAHLATGFEVLEELLYNWNTLCIHNFYLVERDASDVLYISKIVDYDAEYGDITFELDKRTTKQLNNKLIKELVAYLS